MMSYVSVGKGADRCVGGAKHGVSRFCRAKGGSCETETDKGDEMEKASVLVMIRRLATRLWERSSDDQIGERH